MMRKIGDEDIERFFQNLRGGSAEARAKKAIDLTGFSRRNHTIIASAYLGDVGDLEVVQLIDVEEGLPETERHVTLLIDRRSSWLAGHLVAKDLDNWGEDYLESEPGTFDRPTPDCIDDYLRIFREDPSLDARKVTVVSYSRVDFKYRGYGVGVLLYLVAAAAARARDSAIVADECIDGTTSDMARRVWRSKLFSRFMTVGPGTHLVGVFRKKIDLRLLKLTEGRAGGRRVRRVRRRTGRSAGESPVFTVIDREHVLEDTVDKLGRRRFRLGDLTSSASHASVRQDRIQSTERAIAEQLGRAMGVDLSDEDDLSGVEVEVIRAELDLGGMTDHHTFHLRARLPEGF